MNSKIRIGIKDKTVELELEDIKEINYYPKTLGGRIDGIAITGRINDRTADLTALICEGVMDDSTFMKWELNFPIINGGKEIKNFKLEKLTRRKYTECFSQNGEEGLFFLTLENMNAEANLMELLGGYIEKKKNEAASNKGRGTAQVANVWAMNVPKIDEKYKPTVKQIEVKKLDDKHNEVRNKIYGEMLPSKTDKMVTTGDKYWDDAKAIKIDYKKMVGNNKGSSSPDKEPEKKQEKKEKKTLTITVTRKKEVQYNKKVDKKPTDKINDILGAIPAPLPILEFPTASEEKTATIGDVRYNGIRYGITVEYPDDKRIPAISRIKAGTYKAEIGVLTGFMLSGVEGRVGVKLTGAEKLDGMGSIIVGENYIAGKEMSTVNPNYVMKKLISKVNEDKAKLEKEGHEVEIEVKVVDGIGKVEETGGIDDKITRFVKIAMNQIGIKEENSNHTKYGKWYQLDGNAWCAMFVSWCANEAGILGETVPKYASCALGQEWYIKKKRFKNSESGYVPNVGDVIFFKNGTKIFHTGIVVEYKENSKIVYTVEGNSSDKVKQNKYKIDNKTISGYGINGGKKSTIDIIQKETKSDSESKITFENTR